jgi:hypothetical protein
MMTLADINEGFVGYFGTDGKKSGHNLHIIDDGGEKISGSEQFDLAAECDSDAIMLKLQSGKLTYFTYKGCTILGIPKSLDDERPGSKSLLIVGGVREKGYLANTIDNNEFLKNKFYELAKFVK